VYGLIKKFKNCKNSWLSVFVKMTQTIEEAYLAYSEQERISCGQKKCNKIPKECKTVIQTEHVVYSVLVLDDCIASSFADASVIKLWSEDGQFIREFDIGMTEVWEIVRSGNDNIICASMDSKCFKLVNWRTGTVLNTIQHTSGIATGGHKTMLAFGQYLVAGLTDKTLTVFDISVQGGSIVKKFEHDGWVTSVVALPHGKIATGDSEGNIRIWDFATSQVEATLKEHKGHVNSLCLLTENKFISCGFDRQIMVWDIAEKKRVRHVCKGTLSIRQVVAMSDTYFASVSSDMTVRVWELRENQCVAKLRGHTVDAMSVDLQNDTLVSGSKDKTIRIWCYIYFTFFAVPYTRTNLYLVSVLSHFYRITLFLHFLL
jgi:WD40 repeat protein